MTGILTKLAALTAKDHDAPEYGAKAIPECLDRLRRLAAEQIPHESSKELQAQHSGSREFPISGREVAFLAIDRPGAAPVVSFHSA